MELYSEFDLVEVGYHDERLKINSESCPKAGFELAMLEGIWLCYHKLRPAPSLPKKETETQTL